MAKLPKFFHFQVLSGLTEIAIQDVSDRDFVEVVRCWSCRSYNKPRLGFCEMHLVRMHGDDYCSYGKQREEGVPHG